MQKVKERPTHSSPSKNTQKSKKILIMTLDNSWIQEKKLRRYVKNQIFNPFDILLDKFLKSLHGFPTKESVKWENNLIDTLITP